MKIESATAYVTGASGGLGTQFLLQLLERGAAHVYAASRRPIELADPRVTWVEIDLLDPDQVAGAAQLAPEVDLLVNNAGATGPTSLIDAPWAEVRDVLETNAMAPLGLVRAFAPRLEAAGGAVVNVASVMSWLSSPGPYAPSKSLLWSLTNALRLELRPRGVQVLGAHFGYVDTPMVAALTHVEKSDPAVIVGRILDALERGDEECLADDTAVEVQRGLGSSTAGTRPESSGPDESDAAHSAAAFIDVVHLDLDPIEPGQPVRGRMTVDERHHTPWGIVHGGVWAAVIESAASVGASAAVADRGMFAAGLNNVTDFLRSITDGEVEVTARPLHIGSTTQYWAVDVTLVDGRLVASGRVRLANLPMRTDR